MRTDIRAVLGLVVVAAILTACGSKSEPDGEATAQQNESKSMSCQEETIDEDRKPVLHAIIFKANTTLTSRALASLMKSKVQSIDFRALEDDIMVIEGHGRNFGYLNARVTGLERRPSDHQGHNDLVLIISKFKQNSI